MIEIIKELNIEVSKPNLFQAVVAKQYDMNTRFIKATFVDNGDKIYIDPNATVKVIINALRPDGEAKGFDGVTNADGTVTVPLHSWMLELDGTVVCDISVIDTKKDNNRKLTTTSFTLLVEKAAWNGTGGTNDPQSDVLIKLISICSNAPNTFANALKGTANGIDITLDNISPVEHDVKIKVSNIDLTFSNFMYLGGYSAAELPLDDVNKIEAGKTYTVFFGGEEYTCVAQDGFNGVVYFGNTSPISGGDYQEPFALFYNAVSGSAFSNGYTLWVFHDEDESVTDSCIHVVEAGTTVTVNGVEHIPNADGVVTGVKSVTPSMTIITNNSNVNTSVEYVIDTNKVVGDIEEALDRIIAIQEGLIWG